MTYDKTKAREIEITEGYITKEPFYVDVDGETALFEAAWREKIPVFLKGPTGCGKTRLVEHMTYKLSQGREPLILVTVPGHEDLTADDLKGRHLLNGGYQDGPALTAVRNGGILYLDEIVEARSDTTVIIHPLGDHRRTLVVEKLGKVYEASESFMLVLSYNPGYQRKTKDLKQSTKQRGIAINMSYAPAEIEKKIIMHEADVEETVAEYLTSIGSNVRNLKGQGFDEGASTRLLINAGKLIRRGVDPMKSIEVAVINPLTDDLDMYRSIRDGLQDVVENYFPK